MNKVDFNLFALLFVVFGMSCGEESPDNPDISNTAAFDTYLEEKMASENSPALSVLIFKEGVIKYEKHLGQSDVENGTALTQNDIFLMASVSKMITGTALLQLYEDGEFGLDEPINNYLPFEVNVPGETTAITFRMLLTHTSAIDDGDNSDIFYAYGSDSPIELETYLEKYLVAGQEYYDAEDNFHNYAPGFAHDYSNMASALIGVLVAEIAAQDFKEYCRAHIFQPLNMNDTYWSLNAALLSGKTLVKPYEYENGNYEAVEHYTFADYPNGALRSTARDMMTFLTALSQDGQANNHQLLSAGTVNEMLTAQIPNLDATMGLHAFILNDAKAIWGHNGSEQGVSTEVGFNRSNKVGAIVLSNLQDVNVGAILLEAYELGLEL